VSEDRSSQDTHQHAAASWDVQGLGFGLAFAFLGILFAVGRDDGSLRPVHLIGVVVLAAGVALLVGVLERVWADRPEPDHERDREVIELP
jgi:hypothetical protein